MHKKKTLALFKMIILNSTPNKLKHVKQYQPKDPKVQQTDQNNNNLWECICDLEIM